MDNLKETGCCPRFDPDPWDEKEIIWQDKLFVKDHVKSFFHIPINFSKVMTRNMEKIDAAEACEPQFITLSDESSLWGSELYIGVTKDVPNTKMEKISGNFLTKVFEGSYRDAPKWAKEMEKYVQKEGKEIKQMYFYYTTCPKCAKEYGKNYTVILAQN